MVKSYSQIQPLAFPLTPDTLPAHVFYAVYLPPAWREAVSAAAHRTSPRTHVGVRYKSLHATLRATFPALIAANPKAWTRTDAYWLLADSKVDPAVLTALVHSWLQVEYRKLSDLSDLQAQLQPADLEWRQVSVKLGPSQPSGMDYDLVPHLVAHALCQEGVRTRTGLEWYRVVAPGQGAEVISWPPLSHDDNKGRRWYYSHTLTLTLQTLPWSSQGILHMDVGIRRWASRLDEDERVHLPTGQFTSIYLQAPESWLTDDGQRTFCVARAGRERPVDGSRVWPYVWKDRIPEVLQTAYHALLPDIEAITRDPAEFLQTGRSIKAGIVFGSNWKGDYHGIGTGASAADRFELLTHVREAVPWLNLAAPLTKAVPRRLKKEDVEAEERAKALHTYLGSEARLELWYQDAAVLEHFKSALKELLAAVEVAPNRFATPYGQFRFDGYPFLDKFTGKLPLEHDEEEWADIQPIAQARAEAVTRYIGEQAGTAKVDGRVLAFVQIQDWIGDRADSKGAIRRGFASTGRLTQCFFGRDEGLTEKALKPKYENTVLDLLRQTGLLPTPLADDLEQVAPRVPTATSLLGFWLIKQNRTPRGNQTYLPVAVRIRLDRPEVEATVYKGKGWRPYSQALLELAGMAGGYVEERDALVWLRELVREAVGAGPTLLLVDAHNARNTWRWLGNPRMHKDKLCWDRDCQGAAYTPRQYEGLRVVRLRGNDQHETPEWYGVEGETAGVTFGLFEVADRLIDSIAEKAITMKGPVAATKPERPTKNAGMPEIVELAFPFLQPDDDVWDWAWLVHHLRAMHSHFDDATVLPLPLHLASKMEEYLVQVGGGNGEE